MLGRLRYWIAAGTVAMVCAGVLIVVGQTDVAARLFPVEIDAYPARTKVTACADPVEAKPGVAAFRALILSQVGGGDDGLAVCKKIANASGSLSDHADGRAWDWHVRARNATESAMVDRVLDWLLRTDDRGHRNAMARRLGITYIIWNHRYYRVGGNDARWVPYTGTSDPHDTHVHFSFSVAGATRETSWWSERGPLTWSLPNETDLPVIFGTGPAQPVAGDWDGDGRDSVGLYDPATRTFSLRGAPSSGPASSGPASSGPASSGPASSGPASSGPDITTPRIGPFGAIPLAGDWDGTGGDELGVYEPLGRRFSFYSHSGAQSRPAQVFGSAGDLPIVGDWNGDGIDDIGTYTPTTRTFSLLLPNGTIRTEVFGETNDTPVVGDWNGDGVDEVGAFRASSRTFVLAEHSPGEHVRSKVTDPARHLPVIGDWDGTGRDAPAIVTTA